MTKVYADVTVRVELDMLDLDTLGIAKSEQAFHSDIEESALSVLMNTNIVITSPVSYATISSISDPNVSLIKVEDVA